MSEGPTEIQRHGDHRLDPAEHRDFEYWAHQLGVTTEELRQAMSHVGPRVGDIEAHLCAQRGPRPGM